MGNRVANLPFQRSVVERVIRTYFMKLVRAGQMDMESYDHIIEKNMDTWLDNLDDELHLSENIDNLSRADEGPFALYPLEDEQEDQYNSYLGDVLEAYELTMTEPCYKCEVAECYFETYNPNEMKKHFEDDHSLKEAEEFHGNTFEFNEEHVVLSILIDKYLSIKPRPRRYFSIESKEIWEKMKEKLGYDIYAQLPTLILKKFGLLENKVREKKRKGYNKFGRRVYHIKISELKSAILDSEFDSLKIQLRLKTTEDTKRITSVFTTEDTED